MKQYFTKAKTLSNYFFSIWRMRSHPKRLLLSHPDIQQHSFCNLFSNFLKCKKCKKYKANTTTNTNTFSSTASATCFQIFRDAKKYKTNTNTSSSTASTTCFQIFQDAKNTKHLLLSVLATTILWISQIWSFIYRSLSW